MKKQIKQIIKDSKIYDLAKACIDHKELAIDSEKELDKLVTIIINTFERARLNEIPDYKKNPIFNPFKDRGDY